MKMVNTLSDRLRQSAEGLWRARRPAPDDVGQAEGVLLGTIPNGIDHQIRVIWQPARNGRAPRLSIRLWRETGHNRFSPCRDIGIEVMAWNLPALAEAVASGLDLAEEAHGSPEKGKPR